MLPRPEIFFLCPAPPRPEAKKGCPVHPWYLSHLVFGRHEICQMFYASEITEIFNFTQKNAHIATFLSKNWECGMFYFPILKKCQSFCTYILKYKVTLFIMWKIKPEFGKFHRMGNILHQFLRNLLKPKNILHKCHLWPLSKSGIWELCIWDLCIWCFHCILFLQTLVTVLIRVLYAK